MSLFIRVLTYSIGLQCTGGLPCDRCREVGVACVLRSRPVGPPVYALEPTSAPEMRFLGGVSGEIDLLSFNVEHEGYEAPLIQNPWSRNMDSTMNDSKGGIKGNHSPASESSASSTTPRPSPDIESLQYITSEMSLGNGRDESTSADDDSDRLPLPQPLRDVLSRIPHFNLTGKIKYSASIGNANGGSCDVFIGVVVEGHYIGTAKKFAVKRIRAHIHCDTNFTKVSTSAYMMLIRLTRFISISPENCISGLSSNMKMSCRS